MELNFNDITFIAVTFKSQKIIYKFLDGIPKESKKIIIDNSEDFDLKKDLEKKYENIEVIISKNIGQGSGLNIGLKKCDTTYAYVLDPDVIFRKDTFIKIKESLKLIDDFTILTPLNSNLKRPNYKIFRNRKISFFEKLFYMRDANVNDDLNEFIVSVCRLDGYSLFLNMKKFQDKNFFDENFFLFRECTDFVLRVIKKGEKVYLIKNCLIDHLESKSSDSSIDDEIHFFRAWHWMWSKFYFNKKHLGFTNAALKIVINLFFIFLKLIKGLIFRNKNSVKICIMRTKGAVNALLGRSAWYRPKLNKD